MNLTFPKKLETSFKCITKTVLIVFLVEALLVRLLPSVFASVWVMAIADALLLSIITLPLIYLFVIEPEIKKRNLITNDLKQRTLALDQHTIYAETDTKGEIKDVNELFCNISEYSRDELIGQNHRILNSGKHSKEFWRKMYSTVAKGGAWHGEICNRTKSGSLYYVRTSITAKHSVTGRIVGYIALRTDITPIVIQQQQLKHAIAAEQQTKLNQTRAFAIIAHELRTPAASLKMQLNESIDLSNPERQSQLASTAQHLLDVMDDIKTVVNPDVNVLKVLVAERIDNICSHIISSLEPSFPGIAFHLQISEVSQKHFLINRQLTRQVITNLVKNAALHSNCKNIWLRSQGEPTQDNNMKISIQVDDDGQGIPLELQKSIFEPFERGNSTAEGSGIGLDVSLRLARSSGGDLRLSDNEHGGSRFTYELIAEPSSDTQQIIGEQTSEVSLAGITVLIAEDDRLIRMLTTKIFEKAGANVICAENGQEALELFDAMKIPPNLVVTDIMMPKLDGYSLCKGLRERQYKGPIIGVTAATVGDEQSNLLKAGADFTMSKPIDIKLLVSKLPPTMTRLTA